MNPLPRLLATGLFIVLAALTALLTAPAWRAWQSDTMAVRDLAQPPGTPVAPSPASRLVQLPNQLALACAFTGIALSATLIVALAAHPARRGDTKTPFNAGRAELGALSRLAENSAAQHQELSRERDVRRRAEEDAQLKQRLLTQALEEKVQLGRDLHDGIIQSLYAVGLTLESVRPLLRMDPAEAELRLEQCRTTLNGSIRDARTYITGLAPESLRRMGFRRGLETLLEEFRSGRDVRFEVKVDDDATAHFTAEQTIEALQIAREAISNALRHGGCSLVTIRIQQGEQAVGLLVQDDGAGFDPSSRRPDSFGLSNMHARAEQIGATLTVTSRPGQGTRVLANIPIFRPAPVA